MNVRLRYRWRRRFILREEPGKFWILLESDRFKFFVDEVAHNRTKQKVHKEYYIDYPSHTQFPVWAQVTTILNSTLPYALLSQNIDECHHIKEDAADSKDHEGCILKVSPTEEEQKHEDE